MAPFSDLKQKAAKAKDASVKGFQDTKDRYSSVPTAKTNWDYNKPPPPPPPVMRSGSHVKPKPPPPKLPPPPTRYDSASSARTAESSQSSPSPASSSAPRPPPPPIARKSRPPSYQSVSAWQAEVHAQEEEDDRIDWANLSQEDKEVFFSWLDEFFARYLGQPVPLEVTRSPAPAPVAPQPRAPPPASQGLRPGPPPVVASWSKPKLPSS
ncbi:hypothetical protein PLICRDRAFT_57873 [Plicaturopsis crispa FD-325 SS-3]|uniref:Uncharacterized protein n=1 Tax=Plicaturopsis crispa FD-325 SS-3 TaxID=944288 RepID=A0A0C9SQT1_PLICR|nr:hypothetical protein PLICRDRAFT_57873 [Plicaturopsis crispa FD-325 SS-3]